MIEPIEKSVEVPCSPDQAFMVFVERISAWWPLDTHSVSAGQGKAAHSVTLEPRVGGAIYETTHDGARADWGTILECVPGQRLVMTWHPGRGPEAQTLVSLDFAPVGPRRCKVTLVHSGWESLAKHGPEMRKTYDTGWIGVFEDRFAEACQSA